MARHETEMHRERRYLVTYLQRLIDRKEIKSDDVPAYIRTILAARGPSIHDRFSDLLAGERQLDFADRQDLKR